MTNYIRRGSLLALLWVTVGLHQPILLAQSSKSADKSKIVYQCKDETGFVFRSEVPCAAGWTQVWSGSNEELQTLLSKEAAAAKPGKAAIKRPNEVEKLQSKWKYLEQQDKISGGVSYSALLKSNNTVKFGFPYQGQQHATLVVRNHPRYGKDVILYIDRGQFMCGASDCRLILRFDDDKPIRITAGEPSDNDSTVVFLHYRNLPEKLTSVRKLLVEATFYQEGIKIFEFDTYGLKLPKTWNDR